MKLTVFEFPGIVANPARCVIAGAGVSIFFDSIDNIGQTVETSTNEDGMAEAALAAGIYEVDNDNGTVCLVDSPVVDDEGNIAIEEGVEAEANIYTCAA